MSHLTSEKVWWIKDGRIGLAKYTFNPSKEEDRTKSLVSDDINSGDKIRIHYQKRAAVLNTTLSAEPAIPQRFHEGLVSRVLEKMAARKGDLPSARYWRAEWQDALVAGRKYANKGKDGSAYSIAQHDF